MMQFHKPTAVVCCAAFTAAGTVALFGLGPLDPPDGPIVPTYKTLVEVEPRTAINATNTPGDASSKFKITKSGSYYLTGNVTGVSGKAGISVTADCTIDLNGFELTGVNGSLDGILLVGKFRGTVHNGRVKNWGESGVFAGDCDASLFEDIVAVGNKKSGVWVGENSVVSRVRASENGAYGIRVANFGVVSDCAAAQNTLSGIFAGGYTTVTRCNTHGNFEHGISSLDGGNISDCVSFNNVSAGIRAGGGIIRDNVSNGNLFANIFATGSGGTIVQGNACNSGSGDGIYCTSPSNVFQENLLMSNSKVGIRTFGGTGNLILRNYSVGNGQGLGSIEQDNNFGLFNYHPGQAFTDINSWGNIGDK